MGLLDALAGGVEQAATGLSQVSMEQIKAQIEEDRQKALATFNANLQLENAPKLAAATMQAQKDVEANVAQQKAAQIQSAMPSIDENRRLEAFKADKGLTDQDIEEAGGKEEVIKGLISGGNYAPTARDKMNMSMEAGVQTGQVSPIDAAKIQYEQAKLDMSEMSAKQRDIHEANLLKIANDKNATAEKRADAMIAHFAAMAAKGSAGKADVPAVIATANWLVENKIAANPQDAWRMAKTSSEKPAGDADMALAGKILDANPRLTAQQAAAKVQELRAAVTQAPTDKAATIGTKQGGMAPDRASQFKVLR